MQRQLKPWRGTLKDQISQSHSAQVARLTEAIPGLLPVRYFRGSQELDAVARAEGLDCLIPSYKALPREIQTPWVGYLYDFQYRHLPHLFSPKVTTIHESTFKSMARSASHVIVNSKAVQEDCLRFLGSGGASFVALPFGAAPVRDWFSDQPSVLPKYNIPGRFFLISNQFWTHKNHRVAFEALSILAQTERASDVGVVCTGSTTESRDPNYFPSLLQFLEKNQLSKRVRILGHIPKRDQIEIMKRAVAVVQPTLFEGGPGGGAVYDAVSLGVPVLVSDIPVNRELEGQGLEIQFFDPFNSEALAKLMLERVQQPKGERPPPATLIEFGLQRRRAVGRIIQATIQSAMAASCVASSSR
jgi:glycosyltransferase involved in cell wall biosynthesis